MEEVTKPEIQTIKQIMKATWEDGDYGQLSLYKKDWDEDFISRLPITVGTKLLDVACGTGYFCILAAQRGAEVTGVDIASNLIAQARTKAKEHGVKIHFDEGDAEALPYADNSFDIVTSMIGAISHLSPRKWQPSSCVYANPEASLPWPIGQPKASQVKCSELLPDMYRPRLACPIRYCGEVKMSCVSDLAKGLKNSNSPAAFGK